LKLPRDVSGRQRAAALSKFGYSISRQSGSHIRITTEVSGQHHETIPADELRVGTLSKILKNIAAHHKLSVRELVQLLEL
jgi:predicted RNA binding protein YcfA (HicA-like mRNA interferase family)